MCNADHGNIAHVNHLLSCTGLVGILDQSISVIIPVSSQLHAHGRYILSISNVTIQQSHSTARGQTVSVFYETGQTVSTDVEREIEEFVFANKQNAANTVWIRRLGSARPAREADATRDDTSTPPSDDYAKGRLASLCDNLVERLDPRNRIEQQVGHNVALKGWCLLR